MAGIFFISLSLALITIPLIVFCIHTLMEWHKKKYRYRIAIVDGCYFPMSRVNDVWRFFRSDKTYFGGTAVDMVNHLYFDNVDDAKNFIQLEREKTGDYKVIRNL